MPAAFEIGFEPDLDHAIQQLAAQQVRGQAKYVGVVVSAAHLRGYAVVARSGGDPETLLAAMHMPIPVPQVKMPGDPAFADSLRDPEEQSRDGRTISPLTGPTSSFSWPSRCRSPRCAV